MGHQSEQSGSKDDGEPSIILQIIEQTSRERKMLSDQWGSTFFEPQRESSYIADKIDANTNVGDSFTRSTDPAPEKKLTLFALRLAILEKAASGIGTLGFVWATVVLLGGFAIKLDYTDFWVVTIILLIEGARIFSRSHELEWQHQATWSITNAGRHSFRAFKSSSRSFAHAVKLVFQPLSVEQRESRHSQRIEKNNQTASRSQTEEHQTRTKRTWHSSEIPLLPYTGWVFQSRNVSRLLYWLQVLSATACVSLSLTRLIHQRYGYIEEGDTDKNNRKSALNVFYGLALAEALLFLMEKIYWEWKVSYCKQLEEVNEECGFGNVGMVSIKRFFYDAYSKSLNGSIFDGLKMDLVSFGEELLESDSSDEQLIGARILQKFVTNNQFADETLRKIGTSTTMIERLLEMLNWKNPEEEEIRKSAAEILSKLAGKKQNALRVAGIPGAMESISSLLYTGRGFHAKPHEISHRGIVVDRENYEFSAFNQLGLLILKKLATDHDNCGKIGHTRGLLPKIIDLTNTGERFLRDDRVTESQIRAVKRSLQVVKMLASTTGPTGEVLRQEISEIVFTISNIREILQHGGNHMDLQKLGIEILTSLAMDEDARERIGCTGGIIKELFGIFFQPGLTDIHNSVRVEAGEALAMLALDSRGNCARILRLEVVERLVETMNDQVLCVDAARILRNLCAYSGTEHFFYLRGVSAAIPIVLKAIMLEENKLVEISIGLASQIFQFLSPEVSAEGFENAGIKESELARKLVQILKEYDYPSIKVPRMRRYVIELAIWMMKCNTKNIKAFKDFGMEKELKSVADTTSELESFNVFSGSVGLSRHHTTVYALVDTALDMLSHGQH